MPIVFRQSRTVSPGDPITSAQWNSLADAVNSRLRSTLGDGPWRVAWYVYGLFRELYHSSQPTYPPSAIQTTPQGDWFERHQMLDPAVTGDLYPDQPPGNEGGMATGQIMSGWINGIHPDVLPEHERSDEVVTGGTDKPQRLWSRGKIQRGWRGTDPADDHANCLRLADAMSRLTAKFASAITHQDRSWGGYLDPDGNGVPNLEHRTAKTMNRAVHAFVSEFRGTPGDLASDSYWNDEAADWQEVMTDQYYLAPAREDLAIGNTGFYPRWRIDTTGTRLAAGTAVPLTNPAGGGAHDQQDDYVSTHWLVHASGLASATKIKVSYTGGSYTLDLPDDDGAVVRVATGCRKGLAVALEEDADFNPGGGWIELETTEIREMKPHVNDLYVIARMAACRDTGLVDGQGTQTAVAKDIAENYLANGMIVNSYGAAEIQDNPTGYANQNAVFEAARRWSQNVRILNETALAAMEHGADGKTVLWFNAAPPGVAKNKWFDGMDVVHAAPAKGQTNEWVMGVQLKPYGSTNQQLWDMFPRHFAFLDRAHFGSFDIGFYKHLRTQFQASRPLVSGRSITPESPTMMRYTAKSQTGMATSGWLNDARVVSAENRAKHYKSCRIYEPDLEIESVEDGQPGDPGSVKVTLKGRLHSTAGEGADAAPATYSADRSTWNWGTLVQEANSHYRTIENGLRSYLMWQDDHTRKSSVTWGDREMGETANPDSSFLSIAGCTRPHFYFVKLLPKVHEDGNDEQDGHDTPLWSDLMSHADTLLRAMCEGFLMKPDGGPCTDNYPIEWTWEQLLRAASGGSTDRTSPVPTHPTSETPAADVRTDHPWGCGPLPNTYAVAEQFNLLARAVNLLRSVRLPFHGGIDAVVTQWRSSGHTAASAWHGRQCPTLPAIMNGTAGPAPDTEIVKNYLGNESSIHLVNQHRVSADCLGGAWGIYSFMTTCEITLGWEDDYGVIHEDLFKHALPPDVLALYDTGAAGVTAIVEDKSVWRTFEPATATHHDPEWDYGTHRWWVKEHEHINSTRCVILPVKSRWEIGAPIELGHMGRSDPDPDRAEVGPDRNLTVAINPGHPFTITPPLA